MVTDVVDGDTVHAAVAGRNEKVRLVGVGTPEVGADATRRLDSATCVVRSARRWKSSGDQRG